MKQKIVTCTVKLAIPYTDLKSGFAAREAMERVVNSEKLKELANHPQIEIEIGEIDETSRKVEATPPAAKSHG